MDISKLTLDELLKIQAELETRKSELEKARQEKFNAVFPKALDLLLSNGVSMNTSQIEAVKGIIGGGPAGGIGGFVNMATGLVSAGISYCREYKTIGDKEYMFLIRQKSTKERKAKDKADVETKPTVNNTPPAPEADKAKVIKAKK